jgi:uncharacterized protein with GYD domain
MATFIMLCTFTHQGATGIKEAPARIRANAERAAAAGLTVRDVYFTLGGYDQVVIFDAPDDETAALSAMMLGQQGNLRTTTLRAFDLETVAGLIDRLPS